MTALPTTRRRSWELYADWKTEATAKGAEHWLDAERWLGRNDLFYLMVMLLRRPDINNDFLFERCREVQASPNGHLDLWAREHGKSSLITFGLTIQDVLRDPEVTIGIFSHTRGIAKAFLRQIKLEFEGNDILKAIYSDVLWDKPAKKSPKWSEDEGLIVRRKGNPKEATIEAWGLVDGQPTGRHFKGRVYDDVVTKESVSSPEMIKKTTDAWDLSQNLGVQGGWVRYIGTRYCTVADTKILMADWSHKRIADVRPGESVIGWELNGKTFLRPAKVLHAGSHNGLPVRKFGFANGRSVTCTADHLWWRGPTARWGEKKGKANEYSPLGLEYHKLKTIRQLLVPTELNHSREAAWLAGFFDGEGHVTRNGENQPSGRIVFTQSEKNRALIDHACKCLETLGFSFSVKSSRTTLATGNPVWHIHVEGGWRDRYKFMTEVAPIRKQKIGESLFGNLQPEKVKLVSDDDAGTAEVFWLETETGNYIADGFCSKNSLFDTYAEMMSRGSAIPRIHTATHNGRFDGKPVFFTDKQWADRLRDSSRSILAAQMLQNPLADEDATFRTEWLRSYEVRPRTLNVYIMADPSRGRSATSDNTAIAVIGIASNGAKFLLDGACHRMTLSQRWVALRNFYQKWARARGVQHIAVGYERYGAQSDDEYFEERMTLEGKTNPNARFPIEELNWTRDGAESKSERVERLEPDFRNSRFYLPLPVLKDSKPCVWRVDTDPESKSFGEVQYRDIGGPTRLQMQAIEGGSEDLLARAIKSVDQDGRVYDVTLHFIEEYSFFPFGRFKDLIDAASRIYDMDPHPPMAPSAKEARMPEFFDA